ncbi:MAG TPA: TetR/AcrR family transcriptional regulator [Alphaproteobacteria bacterium]|nr:TetR/AcrR family transcriptional regulator [Alphaproteobacteria bacterium]
MTVYAADSGNRRDDILAIAAKLFAETGFDNTTMRQIGATAGMQAASLYHYFRTKDDLFDAIVRDYLMELPGAYRRIMAETKDPRDVLPAFVELALRGAAKNREVMTILVHERKSLAGRGRFAFIEATFQEIETIWLGVLEAGIASGIIRADLNPRVALRMMLDLVGSFAGWYRPNSRRYTLDEAVKTELGFIFGGVMVDGR